MKKNYLTLILFLCALNFGFGQVTENFDTNFGTSYGNYNVNDFDVNNGLSEGTYARSGRAVRLSDVGSSNLEYVGADGNGKDGGVGTISFWYRSWDTSPTAIYDVEISINNGAYTTIGSQISTASTTYAQWSHTLNNTSDNIKVRVIHSSGERLIIDDFEITDYTSTNTTVQFDTPTSTLTEDGVFIDICVSITNPSTTVATTVDISLGGGSTATNGTDYDDGAGTPAAIAFPQTLTFPANTNADQCLTIYISNDDTLIEADETVVLNLTSPSGGDSASIGSTATHTLTILDNDFYDTCATSVTIPVNATCVNQSFTNVGATDSGVADPGCGAYSGGDVWFNLTVPASGSVTVETSDNGGITDSGLALYSGTCGSLSLIDCDDDSGTGNMSLINATGLTPGSTIYVRVWEFNNNDFDTFNICAYSAPEIDVERNTGTSIP